MWKAIQSRTSGAVVRARPDAAASSGRPGVRSSDARRDRQRRRRARRPRRAGSCPAAPSPRGSARKARADCTGASAKPPPKGRRRSFVFSPDHGEEIDLRACRLLRRGSRAPRPRVAPAAPAPDAPDRPRRVGLHQRIDQRRAAAHGPCRGPAPRHARPSPEASRTEQRVTVISPRLNGAPVAPIRPRTITAPTSGGRRVDSGPAPGRRRARPSSAGRAWPGRLIQALAVGSRGRAPRHLAGVVRMSYTTRQILSSASVRPTGEL